MAFEALVASQRTPRKIAEELEKRRLRPSQLLEEDEPIAETRLGLLADISTVLEKVRVRFSVSVFGDFEYPCSLRDARHPLPVFYFRGNVGYLNSRCVSVVGSREASESGIKRARRLSEALVENDFTVVSGLARGIDTAAMHAAAKAGGRIVGVIGTPIDQVYPKENRSLQEYTATHHLLVSEVPFFRYSQEHWKLRRLYFPARNATMSALSEATVIVEASDTSGTLTQARAALQQGRKLFILNNCFENKLISWPASFEKRGAIRVRSIDDILEVLGRNSSNGGLGGGPVEED